MKPAITFNGKSVELNDKNGTPIHTGQRVVFYFSADYGIGESEEDGKYTKMVDDVVEIDGEFFFKCPTTGGAAYAWRYNKYCEVLSTSEQQNNS